MVANVYTNVLMRTPSYKCFFLGLHFEHDYIETHICLWALVVLLVCESISLIIGRTFHCKHRLVFSYHETVAVVFVQVRRTSGNTVLLKLSVISLITGSMRKFTLPGTQNGSCYFHYIACDLNIII